MTEILEKLVKLGADPTFKDDADATPLLYAVVSGNIAAVRVLTKLGVPCTGEVIQKLPIFCSIFLYFIFVIQCFRRLKYY